MSLPGRLLDVGGVRVYFSRSGPRGRTPVVLVHGFLVGHWSFRDVVPRLVQAGLDVITLDLPGCGESDRPPPRDYAYDREALLGTLEAFLEALDLPPVTLVGHSMGGALSLLLASRRPKRLAKLVLVDPLVYPFTLPVEARALLAPFVGMPLFRATLTRGMLVQFLRRRIYHDPRRIAPDWIDHLWDRINRPGGVEAAHAALQFCVEPSAVARVTGTVRTPTRVVWGREDRLFPSAWAERLAGEIRGASATVLDDCGHSPPEEQPEALVRAILPFLAEGAGNALGASG